MRSNYRGLFAEYLCIGAILSASLLYAGMRSSSMSIIHLFVMAAAFFSLKVKPFQTADFFFKNLWISIFALLSILVLNYLVMGESSAGLDSLIFWFDLGVFIWIVSRFSKRSIPLLINIWMLLFLLLSFLHLINVINSGEKPFLPPCLLFAYHFGFWAVLAAFPGLALFYSRQNIYSRLLGLAVFIFASIYVILDLKSGPIAGYAFAAIIWMLLSRDRLKTRLIVLTILIVFASATTFVFYRQHALKDLIMHIKSKSVLDFHKAPMQTALNTGFANFIWGVGIGNFYFLSGQYEPPGLLNHVERAHNSFLELFAEAGIVGIILCVNCIWIFIRLVLRHQKYRFLSNWIRTAILVSFYASLFLGMLDYGLQMPVNALNIAFLCGLLLADSRQKSYLKPGKLREQKKPYYLIIPILLALTGIPNAIAGFLSDQSKTYFESGRIQRGINASLKARLFRPMDDRIIESIAQGYLTLARYTKNSTHLLEAQKRLDEFLKMNPLHAPIYYARALVFESVNSTDGEIKRKFLLKAKELDPSQIDFRLALMILYVQENQIENAISEFESMLERLPKEKYPEVASVLIHYWDPPELLAGYVRDKSSNMPVGLVLSFLSEWQKNGLNLMAEQYLHQNSNLFAEKLDCLELTTLTEICIRLKALEFGQHFIKIGIERECETQIKSRLFRLRGDIYREQNEWESAIQAYENAIDIDSENTTLRLLKIASMRNCRSKDAVFEELMQLVHEFPNNPDTHSALAHELESRGAVLEALYEYKILENLSSSKNVQKKIGATYDNLGLDGFWREPGRINEDQKLTGKP